jgi:hypothetical protein
MAPLGKLLVLFGLLFVAAGLILWGGGHIPLFNRLGRLPGDIYIRREHFSFYFPLTTSIAISLFLSALLMLLRR